MSKTAIRSQKVDTYRVLILGDLGQENGTAPNVRRRERDRVVAYWPEDPRQLELIDPGRILGQ